MGFIAPPPVLAVVVSINFKGGFKQQVVHSGLSCICAFDVVSTWAKFDGHIYHGYPVICKSISTL